MRVNSVFRGICSKLLLKSVSRSLCADASQLHFKSSHKGVNFEKRSVLRKAVIDYWEGEPMHEATCVFSVCNLLYICPFLHSLFFHRAIKHSIAVTLEMLKETKSPSQWLQCWVSIRILQSLGDVGMSDVCKTSPHIFLLMGPLRENFIHSHLSPHHPVIEEWGIKAHFSIEDIGKDFETVVIEVSFSISKFCCSCTVILCRPTCAVLLILR